MAYMGGLIKINNYIKSPLNYVGGKYRLLNEIIPLLASCGPINTFVDLFGGGFNVGVNINADNVIYNDILPQVVELLTYMKHTDVDSMLNEIDNYIDIYKLNKYNKEGYLKMRYDYNKSDHTPLMFYTLLCYAFNNQIRFNKQGEFNMPFGANRSSFNLVLRDKFCCFVERLHQMNCCFYNESFEQFDFSALNLNDLVYCDPPYFNSLATYNENNGWTENDEVALLSLLDQLDVKGVRFALSNNLKYRNPLLDKWKDKYNVHWLDADYNNCNYHKKDKSKDKEVLITNY